MEATAGLQMSQPSPRPCFASVASKLRKPPTRMRENSCWREYGKCSHKCVLNDIPLPLSSPCRTCVTSGAQPPQDVAARVAFLMAPTVVQPLSTAAQMTPLLTLLHEQICASAGSAANPLPAECEAPARGGRIRSSGC